MGRENNRERVPFLFLSNAIGWSKASANRLYPIIPFYYPMPASRVSSSSGQGTFVVPDLCFNRHGFRYSHEDCSKPHPSARDIYVRSNQSSPVEDSFNDLGLSDLIIAHKRVARRKLELVAMDPYQVGLLSRGVQPRMDSDESYNVVLESAIGYAGAVGVMVMDEVARVNERVDKMIVDRSEEERDVRMLTETVGELEAKVVRLEDEVTRHRDARVGLQSVVTTLRGELSAMEVDRRHLLQRVAAAEGSVARFRKDMFRHAQRLASLESWR